MLPFILRRILTFIPVLILLAFFTFILSFYGPGDPLRVMMGENWDDEAAYQQLRHSYGLDRPMLVQFYDYCTDLLRGDFGRSYIQRVEVSELLWNAIPVSAQLALMAIIIVSVVGIGLGIISALFRNSWPDIAIGTVGVILHSIPPFVLAAIFSTLSTVRRSDAVGARNAISLAVSSLIRSSSASIALSAWRTLAASSSSRLSNARAASRIAVSTMPPIFMTNDWMPSRSRSKALAICCSDIVLSVNRSDR